VDGSELNAARLTLEPIGVARTAHNTKFEAARQPAAAGDAQGTIELLRGRNFEHALEDLADWERIWVVFWFHLNPAWRPKVLPPRSSSGRKGVFATRSPHRPNPLGLSVLRLVRIEGLRLFVRDLDLLDGTPVLDIKPYVPYTDAHPAARSGWLAAPADPIEPYRVVFEPRAAAQAAWIEARTGLAMHERVTATLALGPEPHPYRRIRREGGAFRLALKDWRVRFVLDGREVRVLSIRSGYRPAQLAAATDAADDPLAAHRAFVGQMEDMVPGTP
jgi:tRNA-Thr(GGU) m(6)t(6)A37 methyltransferase TsaA